MIFFKTTDNGVNVIQLETASGAAIQSFEGAQGDYSFEIFFELNKFFDQVLMFHVVVFCQ
jgi:hypothetical protein